MSRRLRPLAAAAAAVAAALAAALAVAAGGSSDDEQVTVVALFDNVGTLIPDNEVRVAGVPVGTVKAIELTDELDARVEMEVDSRFGVFYRDAECSLGTKLLLGEKFVQCDPGTPGTGGLEGEPPTVPLERTSAPVDLDLLLDAAREPYRERLAIVLNELGAGLAGRGEDVNEVIRRANPALRDTREVLRILSSQRAELRGAIADTDTILAALAREPDRLGAFVEEAGRVTERTARRAPELERTAARLPGLLRQAEPALAELDTLAVEATPLVADLERSAPGLGRLFGDLEPFAEAGRPALTRLGEAARTGGRAIDATARGVSELRPAARRLRSTAPVAEGLTGSLIDKGFSEGLMRFFYLTSLATARFDDVSHILPVRSSISECSVYNSGAPIERCAARFGGAAGTDAPASRKAPSSATSAGRQSERLLDFLLGP